MRTSLSTLFFIFCGMLLCRAQQNVLIFSKTTAFRHESIPKGVATVSEILKAEGIGVQHTEDVVYFCTDSLANFDALIFLSTTGDLFDTAQKKAIQQFINSGKGFVGIHAASDTEHNWPWYGQLVGGYFASHPAVQKAKIDVLIKDHPSTAGLQSVWWHKDEWYDFKEVQPGLNILMTVDESTYKGGKMGQFHPVAWFREFDGGRTFYTALGHTNESFDSPDFRKHVLGGIKYVLQLH